MTNPMDKGFSHDDTDTLICPYCGFDNGRDDLDYGRSSTYKCGKCEKEFIYVSDFTVTFTSSKMPCSPPETHQWEDVKDYSLKKCRICDKYKLKEAS